MIFLKAAQAAHAQMMQKDHPMMHPIALTARHAEMEL